MEPVTDAESSREVPPLSFAVLVLCFWLLTWLAKAFSLKNVFWHGEQDFSNDALAAEAAAEALLARTFSVKISDDKGGSEATRRLRL